MSEPPSLLPDSPGARATGCAVNQLLGIRVGHDSTPAKPAASFEESPQSLVSTRHTDVPAQGLWAPHGGLLPHFTCSHTEPTWVRGTPCSVTTCWQVGRKNEAHWGGG